MMSRQLIILTLGALIALVAAPSQAAVCEPSAETRQLLKRLDVDARSPYERLTKRKAILAELLAQHPDDLFLNLAYIEMQSQESDGEHVQVIARYKQLADSQPTNTDDAFLYAFALQGADTPAAISRLKALATGSPAYPLAARQLAKIYAFGNFANHDESHSQLGQYFQACPASFYDKALNLLAQTATTEMAKTFAPALRQRLMNDNDPEHLQVWKTVWILEFKARPPSEHAELRKQIANDLTSIERSGFGSETERLTVLLAGYKQVDDQAALRRIEDRIVIAVPNGYEARELVEERWSRKHPDPKPNDSKSAKQEFYRAQLQFFDERLKVSPNDSLYLFNRFQALSQLDDASPKQILETAKALQEALRGGADWWSSPPAIFQIADEFLKRHIHVDEVPALVAEGRESYVRWRGVPVTSDMQSSGAMNAFARNDFYVRSQAARILLEAAEQLKKPELAGPVMDELAGVKTDERSDQSTLWSLRAKWAELNGHKLDALLMYRAALDARPASDKPDGDDELATNILRLRDELGGTADTEKLLAKAPRPAEAATEGRWEISTKEMPAWELSDLAGRNWTSASLHGKTVLINVWATWCGPCRMEHPSLQALYEKIKDRTDVQIVTFDIDEEVGDVAPYMDQNKYTFPVLFAKDYIADLAPDSGIPMLWIVDASGKWRWQQVGFGNDAKWESEILEKLDNTKLQ